MFRNPRENIDRIDKTLVLPSVGRPPTPPSGRTPSSDNVNSQTRALNRTAIRMQGQVLGSAPVAQSRVATNRLNATPVRSPPVRSASKPKQNGSILSFFKKAEGQSESGHQNDDSLFLSGSPAKRCSVPTGLRQISEFDRQDDQAEESLLLGSQEDRYNENDTPSKRRKTIELASELYTTKNNAPKAEVDIKRNLSHSGPFVLDSDSENELEDPKQTYDVPKNQVDCRDEEEAVLEDKDISIAPSVSLPGVDGADVVAHKVASKDPQLTSERLDNSTRSKIAHLKREATSIFEAGDFEGFEGLEDDDDAEYPDGEEFLERRYMARQRRLEMEEEGFEGEVDDDELLSIKKEYMEEDDSALELERAEDAPSCPVCSQKLPGMSEQEISVHVNNCLDGKSILSAAPVSPQEQEEPRATTTSASFRRTIRPPKPGQQNPFAGVPAKSGSSSAFSKLMSGHAESAAWAAAAAEENASRGKPAYQRTCPFYKILPGLSICVDAFRYGAVEGCNAYFLSHFHSDHYIGLTSTWCHGPIYASRGTCNLMRQQLGVNSKYLVPMEWETWTEIPGTPGVKCYMIPANHCPSSSLYLFSRTMPSSKTGSSPREQRILHCGDFRACPAHISHPLLKPDVIDSITGKTRQQKIDICYLDTTYLTPKYAFPSQEDVIKACADMCVSLSKSQVDSTDSWETAKRERAGPAMATFLQRNDSDTVKEGKSEPDAVAAALPSDTLPSTSNRGRLLVVVGTYSIGKERICIGLARALGSKIYAPTPKRRICACLEDPELNRLLTNDPADAQVHMTPLFEIRAETLAEYLSSQSSRFSRAVAFRPTGWNYRAPTSRVTDTPPVSSVLYSANWKSSFTVHDLVPQRGSSARSQVFGVPYSEHSSFRELTMFCCALRIERVIPTVNVGSAKSRERMKGWVERWVQERRKNGLFRVAPPPKEVNARTEDTGVGVKHEQSEDGSLSTGSDDSGRVGDWYPVGSRGTWELRTTL